MFIINCKNYDEIAGDKIIKIAKISERISMKDRSKDFILVLRQDIIQNLMQVTIMRTLDIKEMSCGRIK